MITPKKLFQLIDPIAPVSTALTGDPCGLIIDTSEPADKILVALDFTADVAEEARAIGAKIVVTHHPIIYHPLKNITRDDPAGMALAGGISVISLHTCWDRADGGINDLLAELLELQNIRPFGEVGRVGELKRETDVRSFAGFALKAIGAAGASLIDCGRAVKTVAVVGGAGGSEAEYLSDAGADIFVTGELAHHEMLFARQIGVSVLMPGHFETEAIAGRRLAEKIRACIGELAEVHLSRTEAAPDSYFTERR